MLPEKLQPNDPTDEFSGFEEELWARRLIGHFSFYITLKKNLGPGSSFTGVLNELSRELKRWERKVQKTKIFLKFNLDFNKLPSERKREILGNLAEANTKEELLKRAKEAIRGSNNTL